jgi:hypothetical protein
MKGHEDLRVRLDELIASFDANSCSLASDKRFFRAASASMAATRYDQLRQTGKEGQIPARA